VAQNEWSRYPIAALWGNVSVPNESEAVWAIGTTLDVAVEIVGRERKGNAMPTSGSPAAR
jgi:hypothetical protein